MIGVLGVGAMGGGLVKTLLRERFEVLVFDIDGKKTEAAAGDGAAVASDVAGLVASCDPVLLSLTDTGVAGIIGSMDSDHVSKGLAFVPEPSSSLMLTAGVAFLTGLHRRRRRRSR